ncbi:unnamed protein product [Rhizopus stolonifer]
MSLSNENQEIADGKQSSNKLLRYVSEPKNFGGNVKGDSGDLTTEAHLWLNRMSRFKKSAGLSNQDILFIASDYLVDKAETWWNVVGSKYVRFLNAINPTIACEIEKGDSPITFEVAKKKAKHIKRSLAKYGVVGANESATSSVVSGRTEDWQSNASVCFG